METATLLSLEDFTKAAWMTLIIRINLFQTSDGRLLSQDLALYRFVDYDTNLFMPYVGSEYELSCNEPKPDRSEYRVYSDDSVVANMLASLYSAWKDAVPEWLSDETLVAQFTDKDEQVVLLPSTHPAVISAVTRLYLAAAAAPKELRGSALNILTGQLQMKLADLIGQP